MSTSLCNAWEISNRIQLYLLAGIPEEHLVDSLGARGRTVADHFAHMHNVRLMWLKSSTPDLLEGLGKLEKEGLTTAALTAALTSSGEAISKLLARAAENSGKVKGFKPDDAAFFGYLVSHESYHAGKIDLILRQAGHPVEDKVHYGMWEWGSR